jgi:hypothetical protein
MVMLVVHLERFRCAGETVEMLRMEKPDDEGLANYIDCGYAPSGRKDDGEALTGGRCGPRIEPRKPGGPSGQHVSESSL